MHQELDADGLAHVRGQIHRSVNPGLAVATLMEDGFEDVAFGIGDVSVLPVERYAVCGVVPMPKGQRASAGGDSDLLVE